jgi:hypothetical protein
MIDPASLAAANAADNLPPLPRDLSLLPRHIIQALDGTAAVWLHPGDTDLPASVVLDLDDSGAGGMDEAVCVGVSFTRPAARALAYALLAKADEGERVPTGLLHEAIEEQAAAATLRGDERLANALRHVRTLLLHRAGGDCVVKRVPIVPGAPR